MSLTACEWLFKFTSNRHQAFEILKLSNERNQLNAIRARELMYLQQAWMCHYGINQRRIIEATYHYHFWKVNRINIASVYTMIKEEIKKKIKMYIFVLSFSIMIFNIMLLTDAIVQLWRYDRFIIGRIVISYISQGHVTSLVLKFYLTTRCFSFQNAIWTFFLILYYSKI